MKHPTLQACKEHIKRYDDKEDDRISDEQSEKRPSIASYIKNFTRWMNSWLFTIFSYVTENVRSIVKFLLSYSIGIVLSVTGKEKVSEIFICEYPK